MENPETDVEVEGTEAAEKPLHLVEGEPPTSDAPPPPEVPQANLQLSPPEFSPGAGNVLTMDSTQGTAVQRATFTVAGPPQCGSFTVELRLTVTPHPSPAPAEAELPPFASAVETSVAGEPEDAPRNVIHPDGRRGPVAFTLRDCNTLPVRGSSQSRLRGALGPGSPMAMFNLDRDDGTFFHGDRINLSVRDWNCYWSATSSGGLECDSHTAGLAQLFRILKAGPKPEGQIKTGDTVGFQSSSGNYLCSTSQIGGPLVADRKIMDRWERFHIHFL